MRIKGKMSQHLIYFLFAPASTALLKGKIVKIYFIRVLHSGHRNYKKNIE